MTVGGRIWLKRASLERGQPDPPPRLEPRTPPKGDPTPLAPRPSSERAGAEEEEAEEVAAAPEEVVAEVQEEVVAEVQEEVVAEVQEEVAAEVQEEVSNEQKIKASPLAKTLANDHNIDLNNVIGTGPGGRIVKSDILQLIDNVEITEKVKINFKSETNDVESQIQDIDSNVKEENKLRIFRSPDLTEEESFFTKHANSVVFTISAGISPRNS